MKGKDGITVMARKGKRRDRTLLAVVRVKALL
jgi:hypothetical protein